MNEIERAIESAEARLEVMRDRLCRSNGGEKTIAKRQRQVKTAEVTLAALLEQAEREKGCEYCNDADYICDGIQKIETCQWDECEDGFIVLRQTINYCPMCGKRLEEHHEAD